MTLFQAASCWPHSNVLFLGHGMIFLVCIFILFVFPLPKYIIFHRKSQLHLFFHFSTSYHSNQNPPENQRDKEKWTNDKKSDQILLFVIFGLLNRRSILYYIHSNERNRCDSPRRKTKHVIDSFFYSIWLFSFRFMFFSYIDNFSASWKAPSKDHNKI